MTVGMDRTSRIAVSPVVPRSLLAMTIASTWSSAAMGNTIVATSPMSPTARPRVPRDIWRAPTRAVVSPINGNATVWSTAPMGATVMFFHWVIYYNYKKIKIIKIKIIKIIKIIKKIKT